MLKQNTESHPKYSQIPQSTWLDDIRAAVKAGIELIPFAGGTLGELFDRYAPSPLAHKQTEWQHAVAEGQEDFEKRLSDFERSLPQRAALSQGAAKLARELCTRSERGRPGDPDIGPDAIRLLQVGADRDIGEIVEELKEAQLVKTRDAVNPPFGFIAVSPRSNLFVQLDPEVMGWNPSSDATDLARCIHEWDTRSVCVTEIQQRLSWPTRRLNPALSVLLSEGLLRRSSTIDPEYLTPWVFATPKLGLTLKRLISTSEENSLHG